MRTQRTCADDPCSRHGRGRGVLRPGRDLARRLKREDPHGHLAPSSAVAFPRWIDLVVGSGRGQPAAGAAPYDALRNRGHFTGATWSTLETLSEELAERILMPRVPLSGAGSARLAPRSGPPLYPGDRHRCADGRGHGQAVGHGCDLRVRPSPAIWTAFRLGARLVRAAKKRKGARGEGGCGSQWP